MQSDEWLKIKEVFTKTLDLPESEQEGFLANYDDALRSEVIELVNSHKKAQNFIAQPAALELGLTRDIFIGKEINGYKIIDRIGAGGMGTVYLAERLNSDFKQKVALKIIKRGMDSEAILQRFAMERRILSTLRHPNIAHLLDGGISSEDLPFFVMEYIDGKPVNQYCRENEVDLESRLKIFRQICSAVENAHQNLIVHRDLKPSNILITADGTPKLLDFGIAKLLSDDSNPNNTITQGKMFTPDYASPEQILGRSVTTATDIYSLGVILYELLTSHHPFNTKGKSYEEIVRGICETEPPKPSHTSENHYLTGENKIETTQVAKSKLRGDLDNIILKALQKEPAERYGSVQQFSEDILRFLQGLPILARPQTIKYRLGKYTKRHKAGVFAATLIFLSLISGISLAAWQAVTASRERAKAEHRFDEVRKLANSILFDHYERIKNLPGATEARAKLVSDALTYLDSLAQEAADNPQLQRDLVAAYQKLGDIQGGAVEGGNLGDETAARENYLKALAIQEKLAVADVSNIQDQRSLGKLYLNISEFFEKENERPIQASYVEKGLQIFQDLKNKNANRPQAQNDLAKALWSWANIIRLKGDNENSINTYIQAAQIYQTLSDETGNLKLYGRNAALTYKNIGSLYYLENDYPKAFKEYQKAFLIDQQNAAQSAENVESQMDLAFSHKNLAQAFYKLDETEKAFEELRSAIAIQEKIVAVDTQNKFAVRSLFNSYVGIAEIYTDKKDFETANSYYQKAKSILDANGKQESTAQQTYAANFFLSYGKSFLERSAEDKLHATADLAAAQKNLLKAKGIYETLQRQNVLDPAYNDKIAQADELLEKTKR